MIRLSFNISSISEILVLLFYIVFVYPIIRDSCIAQKNDYQFCYKISILTLTLNKSEAFTFRSRFRY
jgi:hypothetical protein